MITVTSFGFAHFPAPEDADVVYDLRRVLRDPHVDPRFRQLTARDQAVRDRVLATPGAAGLLASAHQAATALAGIGQDAHVAFGCVGGRHRSATLASQLASTLDAAGYLVHLAHRDIHRPVVDR